MSEISGMRTNRASEGWWYRSVPTIVTVASPGNCARSSPGESRRAARGSAGSRQERMPPGQVGDDAQVIGGPRSRSAPIRVTNDPACREPPRPRHRRSCLLGAATPASPTIPPAARAVTPASTSLRLARMAASTPPAVTVPITRPSPRDDAPAARARERGVERGGAASPGRCQCPAEGERRRRRPSGMHRPVDPAEWAGCPRPRAPTRRSTTDPSPTDTVRSGRTRKLRGHESERAVSAGPVRRTLGDEVIRRWPASRLAATQASTPPTRSTATRRRA